MVRKIVLDFTFVTGISDNDMLISTCTTVLDNHVVAKTVGLFEQDQPDRAMEWACCLVECSPYYDSYCEWRDRQCMEVSARRSIA